MKRVFKVTGIIILSLIIIVLGAGFYVKTFLPNVGKPPELKVERTPVRIERGKYLANTVAACTDCHSSRNWSQFAGPIDTSRLGCGGDIFSKEMGFPGTFYAPNITPYHLGNWTDGEIYRAITAGVNKEGKALFPIMGYKRFGKMADEDIYSIIAYLRTLPSVKNDVAESKADFPVSLLLNTMPEKGTPGQVPNYADQIAYGGYLINVAGCVDCHSEVDSKGGVIAGTEFGGGMEFNMPGGVLRSPNITFDQTTGIGTWTEAAFLNRFRIYADSNYHPPVVAKNDFNTPMPWNVYSKMKSEDINAIYAYLKTVKPIQHKVTRYQPTVAMK
jgi:hypothetical protein